MYKRQVYITLNEVETLTPTSTSFGAKLLAALRNGWTGFVSGAQAVACLLYTSLKDIGCGGLGLITVQLHRLAAGILGQDGGIVLRAGQELVHIEQQHIQCQMCIRDSIWAVTSDASL